MMKFMLITLAVILLQMMLTFTDAVKMQGAVRRVPLSTGPSEITPERRNCFSSLRKLASSCLPPYQTKSKEETETKSLWKRIRQALSSLYNMDFLFWLRKSEQKSSVPAEGPVEAAAAAEPVEPDTSSVATEGTVEAETVEAVTTPVPTGKSVQAVEEPVEPDTESVATQEPVQVQADAKKDADTKGEAPGSATESSEEASGPLACLAPIGEALKSKWEEVSSNLPPLFSCVGVRK